MNKAYSYIRFSSDEQKHGHSLDRQLERARKYCEENQLILDDKSYRDLGSSAYHEDNLKKGELLTFLQDCENGKVKSGSYLILESLDRLSRGEITSANPLFIKILMQGITVVTLIDNKTYSKESINDNPMDLMYTIMQQAVAHEESRKKSDRANDNWQRKKDAIINNKAPYSRKVPSWIAFEEGKDGEKDKYKLIPERAEIVKLIFDLALAGKGRTAITRYLNDNDKKNWSTYGHKPKKIENGQKTRKATEHWGRSSVQKILISKASYGTLETAQIKEVKKYFPPAISEADYLKAQQIRSKKRLAVGSSNKTLPNLFSGLSVCGKCGARLHYLNKGKGNRYLVCSKALDKGKCDYNSWQYAYTEKHIIYSLREMDYKAVFSKHEDDHSGKIVVLEEKAKQLEKGLETTLQLSSRSDLNDIVFDKIVAESNKIAEELEQVSKEIQTLQNAMILAKEDISLKNLGKLFDSAGEDSLDKRLALNQLLKANIDTIKFTPIKEPSEDVNTLGDSIHSRIEIYFKNATKTRTITIYDERVKYSKLQNKSTSCITSGDTTSFDTDIIINGDGTVERHKTGATVTLNGMGMDFTREVEV